jgi:hypothetical protein
MLAVQKLAELEEIAIFLQLRTHAMQGTDITIPSTK